MFTHCLFDATKNKSDFYRGKDCMKIFGKDLKEHAGKVKNCQKKKRKKEIDTINLWKNKYYKKQKSCYICNKGSS